MTKPAVIRFPIDPRMIPVEKVARRLGLTMATFEAKRSDLEQAGFPKPDPLLGNYSLQAVDSWLDARTGLTSTGGLVSDPNVIRERIRSKAWGG